MRMEINVFPYILLVSIAFTCCMSSAEEELPTLPDLPAHGDIDVNEAERAAKQTIDEATRAKLEAEKAAREALLAKQAANKEIQPGNESGDINKALEAAEEAANKAKTANYKAQEQLTKANEAADRASKKAALELSKAEAANDRLAAKSAREATRRADAARRAATKAARLATIYAVKATREAAKAVKEAKKAARKQTHQMVKTSKGRKNGHNKPRGNKHVRGNNTRGGNDRNVGRSGYKGKSGMKHRPTNKVKKDNPGSGGKNVAMSGKKPPRNRGKPNSECNDGTSKKCIACNSSLTLKECVTDYKLQECAYNQQCVSKRVVDEYNKFIWWSGCHKPTTGECDQENMLCKEKYCNPDGCLLYGVCE